MDAVRAFEIRQNIYEDHDSAANNLRGRIMKNKLNPDIAIFGVSAKTGEGIKAWTDWLTVKICDWND